jgi:ribose-phosphate pyrophosphokinase
MIMKLKIFAPSSSRKFGAEVAGYLKTTLSELDENRFEDGECYAAPQAGIKENVRGCDVFIISSMYSDQKESINDKIMKTMILCGALRDASAARITIVAPYYPYARQDRKTSSRAPITTKYLARAFESLWVNRILTIDVHSPTAIQNAFPFPCDLLEANHLFANYIIESVRRNKVDPSSLTVLSPDASGLNRARKFRKMVSDAFQTEIGLACMDKVHVGRSITGHGIMGDVVGRNVLIYDDMISGGSTNLEATEACFPKEKSRQAKSIYATIATHGLFVGKANEKMSDKRIERVIVSDCIEPFRVTEPLLQNKLRVISTTRLFAEAITRIHQNESISDLIVNGN